MKGYLPVAIFIVVAAAIYLASQKKEGFSDIVYSQPENPISCNVCGEFGCQGPSKCQPSSTYFTGELNREKSRAVTIPAEAKTDGIMEDFRKFKALQAQMFNKQNTIDVLNQQLTGLAATTAFLNGAHAEDVKLQQELDARDKPVTTEGFAYGGPIIVQDPVMPLGWQLGLSPYISGRN